MSFPFFILFTYKSRKGFGSPADSFIAYFDIHCRENSATELKRITKNMDVLALYPNLNLFVLMVGSVHI